MPPNFQQQSAQRMHQQAVHTQQRMHRNANDAAMRAGRMAGQPHIHRSMAGHAGRAATAPFRLVGFLFKVAFLLVLLAVAITFGPQLIEEFRQQAESEIDSGGGGGGTEQPAP